MKTRHNQAMTKKKIPVVGHFRKGQAVVGHNRTILNEKPTSRKNIETKLPPETNLKTLIESSETTEYSVIRGVQFTDEILAKTDFSKISKLENCRFEKVELGNLQLSSVEFLNCSFIGTQFKNNQLKNITFKECTFKSKTNFDCCELDSTSFISCKISGTNFLDSRIHGCIFESCEMAFVNIKRWDGEAPGIKETKFINSKLDGLGLEATELFDSSFVNCQMDAIWQHLDVKNIKIEKCESVYLVLYGTVMKDSDMTSSTFLDNRWAEVGLQSCKLGNVSIQNSQIVTTDFIDCDFQNFHLIKSTLENVSYPKMKFGEVQKKLGVSEKQFEFLVLSGALEVRDDNTGEIIDRGYDPDLHHIPSWVNLKNLSSSPETDYESKNRDDLT